MGNSAPDGYLVCDGGTYSISDYPLLAHHFEQHFGTINHFGGDGVLTFAVPNLQGQFLRGAGTSGRDYGESGGDVGEHQYSTRFSAIGKTGGSYDCAALSTYAINSERFKDALIGNSTASLRADMYADSDGIRGPHVYTSRPVNTSVLFCIKF